MTDQADGATGGPGGNQGGDLDQALGLLSRALRGTGAPEALPPSLADNAELAALVHELAAIREFLLALSRGDLEARLAGKGALAGALKALQANLRHLSWQTRMVAGGDYTQRVDFLGDFSTAFNSMVEQLGQTVAALNDSRAELLAKNRQLKKEIEQRSRLAETLRQSKQRYLELAAHDELTGLFNRRQFYLLAERELLKQSRHKKPLCLLMLDIDRFKLVNDTYGHAVGDEVLCAVAEIVRGALRAGDVAARFGGEELVLLLADTGAEGGLLAAERLRQDIALWHVSAPPATVRVTVSIGVAMLTSDAHVGLEPRPRLEAVIREADEAMYAAKTGGRDRCMLHGSPEARKDADPQG